MNEVNYSVLFPILKVRVTKKVGDRTVQFQYYLEFTIYYKEQTWNTDEKDLDL